MSIVVPTQQNETYAQWYDLNMDRYKQFADVMANTVAHALQAHHIAVVDIPSRVKDKSSFLQKLQQQQCRLNQITDLAALRIVTLMDKDLEQVLALMRQMFVIHEEYREETVMDEDGNVQVTYPSLRLVCELNHARCQLPEFSVFKGMRFEIQIKTALEHTFTEIHHHLTAQFGNRVPSHLKYRLKMLSNMLAEADQELNNIQHELANYQKMMVAQPAPTTLTKVNAMPNKIATVAAKHRISA